MQKTMQKTMQKDAKTIQKAIQKALEERGINISSDSNISEGGTKSSIARLQELELLKRKGGKKNGE